MENSLQQPSTASISPTTRTRRSLLLRRRAEEQVVCALLHAISSFGIYALVASIVVWATQRGRSRFIAFQSLQALLFQSCVLVASLLVFGLFMGGFLFAAFSGLEAQTGVNQPGLTAVLAGAWILGMGTFFVVTSVLPLWGIWAGLQILRGRNFRYPVLGEYALKWGVPKDAEPPSQLTRQFPDTAISSSDKVLAGICHLSIFMGVGPILGPIIWAAHKHRSAFLTYQVLQASLFQIVITGSIVVIVPGLWGGTMILDLLGGGGSTNIIERVMCVGGIFMLVLGLSVLGAAIQTFRGQEFSYPLIGGWLARYLKGNEGRNG